MAHDSLLIYADTKLLRHVDAWLNYLEQRKFLRAKTLEAYSRDVKQFLAFLTAHTGAPVSVSALKSLKITDLRSYLTYRRGKGIGAKTQARGLAGLRSFLSYLRRQNVVDVTAINSLTTPKQPKSLPRPVKSSDALDMMSLSLDSDDKEPWIGLRNRAVISLLYGCGLRISEALGLVMNDLAFLDEGMLRVTGKGGRERMVPVLPMITAAVNDYVKMMPFARGKDAANDPLFKGKRGGALSPRTFQKVLENLRGQLGLPQSATPHALRHAFASHLLAGGGDLRTIQELLGHASLATTQVYTKIDTAQLLDVYSKAHPHMNG